MKNLILKEVNISNTYDVVSEFTCSGGIVARNYGIISNCAVESGNIIGRKTSVNTTSNIFPGAYSGGICASNYGTVSSCYNKANIEGYAPVRS